MRDEWAKRYRNNAAKMWRWVEIAKTPEQKMTFAEHAERYERLAEQAEAAAMEQAR